MKKLFFIGLIILCFACSTAKHDHDFVVPELIKDEIDLFFNQNEMIFDCALTVSFKPEISAKWQKLQWLKSIEIAILDKTNKPISTTNTKDFIIAGSPVDSNVFLYFGKLVIKGLTGKDINDFKCAYNKSASKWMVSDTIQLKNLINPTSERPLSLYPFVENLSDSSLDLGLLAVRKKFADEYIPNSEIIRIEVLNDKNKTVFNSQEGKAFMQIIMSVEPQNLGDYYIYQYSWDYRNNNGSRVPSGEYTVKMMIPAVPKPYITEIKIPVETK